MEEHRAEVGGVGVKGFISLVTGAGGVGGG